MDAALVLLERRVGLLEARLALRGDPVLSGLPSADTVQRRGNLAPNPALNSKRTARVCDPEDIIEIQDTGENEGLVRKTIREFIAEVQAEYDARQAEIDRLNEALEESQKSLRAANENLKNFEDMFATKDD